MRGRGVVPGTSAVAEALRSARALPGEPRPDRGGGGLAEGVCSLFPSEVAGGGALGARDELRGLCPLWDTAAKSELASASRSVPGVEAKELKAREKGKTTPWCAS